MIGRALAWIGQAATVVVLTVGAAQADFAKLHGTWVAPGDSCDPNDPPQSIMVIAKDRLDFMEVGCTYKARAALVAPGAYKVSLECRGIDSGPWTTDMLLLGQPDKNWKEGNVLIQYFGGDQEVSKVQRCN